LGGLIIAGGGIRRDVKFNERVGGFLGRGIISEEGFGGM